jgi:hypothetical protein
MASTPMVVARQHASASGRVLCNVGGEILHRSQILSWPELLLYVIEEGFPQGRRIFG